MIDLSRKKFEKRNDVRQKENDARNGCAPNENSSARKQPRFDSARLVLG